MDYALINFRDFVANVKRCHRLVYIAYDTFVNISCRD